MGILPDWIHFEISFKPPPPPIDIEFAKQPAKIEHIEFNEEEVPDGSDSSI